MKRSIRLTSQILAGVLLATSLFSTGSGLLDKPAEAVTTAGANVFAGPGVIATASSYPSEDHSPALAIDGKTTEGKWVSEGQDVLPDQEHPDFLKVDVGAEATVEQFVIAHAGAAGEPHENNTRAYTIEASNDDVNWTPVVTVSSNTEDVSTHNLDAPVTARYFKLNIQNPGEADATTGLYVSNIYEFQAFGALAGETDEQPVSEPGSQPGDEAGANPDGTPDGNPVDGIKLNKDTLELGVGESEQLNAFITRDSNAAPETYTWSSDDTSIATVSDSGLVTAVAPGTTGITAEAEDGLKASALVTVTDRNKEPQALASGQANGLLGEYFTGTSDYGFGAYKATLIDPQINFTDLNPILQSWTGSEDHANVRWTGQIMPPADGDYTFYMIGDNGFRLWINDQLVIDHWQNDWDLEQTSSPITLQGGVKYSFKVEYFEDFGGSNLYLRWSTSSMAKGIVPSNAFYLPDNYTGPLSGNVDADGLTVTLNLSSNLAELPQGIESHFSAKIGEREVQVQSVELGSTASVLKLKLQEPVVSKEVLNLSYDGQAGLAFAEGGNVGVFTFSPVNNYVNYSPIAIAMSLFGSPQTNRSFAWYTSYEKPDSAPANILDSIVEVVPADQDFDSPAVIRFEGDPADTRVLPNLKITSTTTGSFISHKAMATGLTPGTSYKYRVGNDGHWSPAGTFTTEAEGENKYEFLYMTDSQGSNTNDYSVWANTLKNGLEDFPDAKFLLMTGDQVDAGSLESQWLDYFGQPQEMLMNLPVMAAVGNHEGPYNDNYYYHFNYPNDSIPDPLPPGSVYSFDYGEAHIMVLNTMDIGWDERQKKSFDEEIKWLKREVAETDKKWKIVAFHKAIYSVGNHALDSDILALRQTLYPVFDELGIDVVLQGHDHTFMRSYQMYNDQRVQDIQTDAEGNVVEPGGTLYMINNSAATKFYDLKAGVDRYYTDVFEQPRVAIYSGVQMTEDSFTIDSYKSGEASPFDTYTIRRDDSKPNPVEGLAANLTKDRKTVLTWTKPADVSTDDAIRGFRIYEVNGKLGKNWSVYVPAVQGQTDYEYTVDGADPGISYEFAVRSVDKRDNSEIRTAVVLGSTPPAPTAPAVDDAHNTFGWTFVPGYEKLSDYEYSVDAGITWKAVTANPQPVGDQDYPAGAVMVRIKANETLGTVAGLPLASDKPFSVNGIRDTFFLGGTTKREDGQLQVDLAYERLTAYSGEAYAVFELMDGNKPVLINAIPLKEDENQISQFFNVSGQNYSVKVFVFDSFDSTLNVPIQLAQPVVLK